MTNHGYSGKPVAVLNIGAVNGAVIHAWRTSFYKIFREILQQSFSNNVNNFHNTKFEIKASLMEPTFAKNSVQGNILPTASNSFWIKLKVALEFSKRILL